MAATMKWLREQKLLSPRSSLSAFSDPSPPLAVRDCCLVELMWSRESMNNGEERRLKGEAEEDEMKMIWMGKAVRLGNEPMLMGDHYRRRLRSLPSTATASRIQKGLIRYLYIIIDLSKAAAGWTLNEVEWL